MPSVLNITNTWVTEFDRNLLLRPIFLAENITSLYRLDPTVHKSKTYTLQEQLRHALQIKTTCGRNATAVAPAGERVLETCQLELPLDQCYDEIYNSAQYQMIRNGSLRTDLTGTDVQNVITTLASNVIVNDMFDFIWFGNTTSTVWIYNCKDGIFKQLEDELPAAQKVNIADGALGVDDALDAMRTMLETSPLPLKAVPVSQKVFYVTDSIYWNLLITFQNTGADMGLQKLADGGPLTLNGVKVIPYPQWDQTIADLGLVEKNRIVLTVPSNIIIGTDIALPGSDAMVWYSMDDQLFKFNVIFDLGGIFMFDELVMYAR